MGRFLIAIGEIVLGVAIIIGGIAAGIAWLAFCFGTVIIGIALLFIEPMILIAPFLFGLSFGGALVTLGYESLTQDDQSADRASPPVMFPPVGTGKKVQTSSYEANADRYYDDFEDVRVIIDYFLTDSYLETVRDTAELLSSGDTIETQIPFERMLKYAQSLGEYYCAPNFRRLRFDHPELEGYSVEVINLDMTDDSNPGGNKSSLQLQGVSDELDDIPF